MAKKSALIEKPVVETKVQPALLETKETTIVKTESHGYPSRDFRPIKK